MLAVFNQHFAVDDRRHDASRGLLHTPAARREVMHDALGERPHGIGIEDHNIRRHSGPEQAAVVEPQRGSGIKGQPPDRVFERHDLLLAHPFGQEPRAVPVAAMELDMRSAVRQPDDGVRVCEDLGHRFVVDIVLGLHQAGIEVLFHDEVEEGVDDALALLLGDLADRLALQPLVLFQHWGLDPHVVVPATRVAGGRDLDLVFDHLVMQLLPDRRVGIGLELFLVG